MQSSFVHLFCLTSKEVCATASIGKTLRGIDLHLDNAPAPNAKWSQQEIARTKATMVVRPAYSPDTAPSDFFLFAYLKGKMASFTESISLMRWAKIFSIFDD
jgi:hypothetical protein